MKRLWFLSMSVVFLTTGCATIEDFNYRNVNRARALALGKVRGLVFQSSV